MLIMIAFASSILTNLLLAYALLLRRSSERYMAVMKADIPAQRADSIERPGLRRFVAVRHEDVTGISGTGIRVEGVVFSDGWGVTHWLGGPPQDEPKTEVWHNPFAREGADPFTKISGHNGATQVVYLD